MQQNLSKYYRFKSADTLCEQFNKYANKLKKEKEAMKEKYPWLEPDDERNNISNREIFNNYADLDKLCLTEADKKQVMDMLYIEMHSVYEMK